MRAFMRNEPREPPRGQHVEVVADRERAETSVGGGHDGRQRRPRGGREHVFMSPSREMPDQSSDLTLAAPEGGLWVDVQDLQGVFGVASDRRLQLRVRR